MKQTQLQTAAISQVILHRVIRIWTPPNLHPNTPSAQRFCDFLDVVITSTETSTEFVIIALIYLQRLKGCAGVAIGVCEGGEYRLFITALVLADKFFDDHRYSNKVWSEVSGIANSSINTMEKEFLSWIDWNLHIPVERYHESCQTFHTDLALVTSYLTPTNLITPLINNLSLSPATSPTTFDAFNSLLPNVNTSNGHDYGVLTSDCEDGVGVDGCHIGEYHDRVAGVGGISLPTPPPASAYEQRHGYGGNSRVGNGVGVDNGDLVQDPFEFLFPSCSVSGFDKNSGGNMKVRTPAPVPAWNQSSSTNGSKQTQYVMNPDLIFPQSQPRQQPSSRHLPKSKATRQPPPRTSSLTRTASI
ncbi:hypothetical protein HDU76_005785, partial [Blyttiomyces sp. JEL0837]